ncbi:MAG: hypothetical protein ACYDCK_06940 [Thermoplasmatota archaeon]
MRTVRVLALALIALFVAAPLAASASRASHSASPYSTTRRYVGGPGDNLAYGFCNGAPDKPVDGVGGACFTLVAGETIVGAAIADKTTLPVVGLWYFTDARASVVTDFHAFCGSTSGISIPANAAFFWVNVEDLYSDAPCNGLAAPATAGIVTASFS